MLVSADDAAATLRLVVPGFVALQVFYWLGLATKRTDWRWLIWSLIASVPLAAVAERVADDGASPVTRIATCARDLLADELPRGEFEEAVELCATRAIAEHNAQAELVAALILAVVAGLVSALVWRLLVALRPSLLYGTELNAWMRVLREGRWVQIRVKDDKTYYGWTASMADPVDADDLDIYLAEPQLQDGGHSVDLGLEGMLIRRDDILYVEVLSPPEAAERSPWHALTWGERIRGRSRRITIVDPASDVAPGA